jgi:nucleoid DNA-binding protein
MSAVKDDLITAVQAEAAKAELTLNKKETEAAIEAVFAGIIKTCKDKESVRTRLGTFLWAHQEACVRKNPRNGEAVDVPAYSTLKLRVSKLLREEAGKKKAAAAKPAAKAAPAKAAAAKPAAKAAAKPVAKKLGKK